MARTRWRGRQGPDGRSAALAASRLPELAVPTVEDGLAGLLADRAAFEEFEFEAVARRGMAFEQLDQLALEHLLGTR